MWALTEGHYFKLPTLTLAEVPGGPGRHPLLGSARGAEPEGFPEALLGWAARCGRVGEYQLGQVLLGTDRRRHWASTSKRKELPARGQPIHLVLLLGKHQLLVMLPWLQPFLLLLP